MENNKYFKRANFARKSIWALVLILALLNVAVVLVTISLFNSSEVMLVINLSIVFAILLFTGAKWLIISPYIKRGINLNENTQRYRD